MTAVRSLLFNLYFYGLTTVMAVAGLPLLLGPRGWVAGWRDLWVRLSLAGLAAIAGLRHQVTGGDRLAAGPFLVAAQHQSAWETLALHSLVDDPALVLKRELYRIPLFGLYLAKTGMAAIDRAGGAGALKRMVADAGRLAGSGRPILIFPQGTRVAPGQAAPYHPGVYAVYKALGRPCLPVALNSGYFWGRTAFTKRAGVITLACLEPIPPGLDRKAFMALLQERLEGAAAGLYADARRQLAAGREDTGEA
ncbi:MAG: lysophospholipid acyltransferase family protein [Pseudomonadota bacterium]|nr:lysophospholipid acyltransferase family protein [Pseudomonadota bacterium]